MTATDRLLVDPELDRRLARDHRVLVPLVPPAELEEVEAAYWQLVPRDEHGIVLDYLRADRALAAALADLMAPIWERVVPELFEHHYPVYTSFVVKHPGEDSAMFLHRDLGVDDERSRRTLAMWMPFSDTSAELDNGPLAFVAGSEQIHYGGFGPNAVGVFSPYDPYLRDRLVPTAVPAGSALVYDARLLHGSAPNRTSSPRLAVGCLMARRDQPVIQVVATGRRHRRVHEVDRRYFVEFPPGRIATDGMPERYPVIDEYDEEPAVSALDVLGPKLASGDPSRQVIVPEDMERIVGRHRPMPLRQSRPARHRHDLDIRAADLSPAAAPLAGIVHVECHGDVGAAELVRRGRRTQSVPSSVPDVIVPLDPVRTRDATLLVVDPGGRVSVTASAGRFLSAEIAVVECPAVQAGVFTGGRVAELDLAVVVDLGVGPAFLWNGGPGPLVVVLRVARRFRGPRGGRGASRRLVVSTGPEDQES